MTYRWDSDFVQPYGWIQPRAIKDSHPQTANQSYSLDYPQGNGEILKIINTANRTVFTNIYKFILFNLDSFLNMFC